MTVLYMAAFTTDPAGGNPAGVVLDARGLTDTVMQAVAADVGYPETAFAIPRSDGFFAVRYFSPFAEVAFCEHATVAWAVAHARRHGTESLTLRTKAGTIPVVTAEADNMITATLTSIPPLVEPLALADLTALLAALGWERSDLDPALPPRVAFAGNRHPIIAVATRARLSELRYDFEALATLMERRNWTTIQLVWKREAGLFCARNPFPPGGFIEDPATGSAAAALGAYLRALGLVNPPATIQILQGYDMGRPSRLTVSIPSDPAFGIDVTGFAVEIPPSLRTS